MTKTGKQGTAGAAARVRAKFAAREARLVDAVTAAERAWAGRVEAVAVLELADDRFRDAVAGLAGEGLGLSGGAGVGGGAVSGWGGRAGGGGPGFCGGCGVGGGADRGGAGGSSAEPVELVGVVGEVGVAGWSGAGSWIWGWAAAVAGSG